MQFRLDRLSVQIPAATATFARRISRRSDELLEHLARRRARAEDFRLASGELRPVDVAPRGISFEWPGSGGPRPVGRELFENLRLWAGLGRSAFTHALYESPDTLRRRIDRAVEERADTWGGIFARCSDARVLSLLPASYRPLDHLEAATAFRDECVAWADRGIEILIDSCDESGGELFLSACAPSLAATVREGDWLYAGIYLFNSEHSIADLEVKPRIYRAVCANGAITQEAEGEGFEVRKVAEPATRPEPVEAGSPDLRARMAKAFELAFRTERVEREAAIGRRAAAGPLVSPFEHLQHLVARGLLTEDERGVAQRLFDDGNEPSVYGLANAVTAAAHGLRPGEPRRAAALEYLGAEIVRGDHGPPVGVPVWA